MELLSIVVDVQINANCLARVPTVIPALKANELVGELRQLLAQRHPSEIATRRIRLEADKLVRGSIAPAEGHMILAALDAFTFDLDGVKDHYRIAQQLSSDRIIPFNFCVLARRVGLLAETRRVADSLLSRYPDDLKVLGLVDQVASTCCDFDLLMEVRSRISRLGAKWQGPDHAKFEPVLRLAKSMSISVNQIVERLEAAATILQRAREPIFGAMFDISPDGTVAYAFGLDASVVELTDYSLSIVDVLIEKFDDPLADLITISCQRKRELPTRELSLAGEEAGA